MSALRPLPEPGTIEAFVVDFLAVVSVHTLATTRLAPATVALRVRSERFLHWVEACARLVPEAPHG